VQNCLHCVAKIPADKVPPPLAKYLHEKKPNEILHFDFLYVGLSRGGKYPYSCVSFENRDALRGPRDGRCHDSRGFGVGREVVFYRRDQCSLTNSYVDNNSSLISE
jgi:hypothetical protein